MTNPSSGTKAFLIDFPSSVLIGIFCKFGSDDASLPVLVEAMANEVCILPVFLTM